ncbi:hypothetical protein V8D89_005590 [Ganoderma adspersum]
MLDVFESQQSYSSASQASDTTDGPLTLKATDTGAGVLNTPLAAITITETSGQTYGIAEKDTKRYTRLRDESLRWLVGTMPVPQFMHAFLGGDRVDMARMPPADNMFDSYLEEKKRPKEGTKEKKWPGTEKEIQTVIINAMHDVFRFKDGRTTTRCPGFTFCDTSAYPDDLGAAGRIGAVKPDICLYADDHLPKIKNGIKKPEDKYSDMGFSALHFEVKSMASGDFFLDITASKTFKGTCAEFTWIVDRGNPTISVTRLNNARHNLGQTVAYATEGCKRQHRRHYFTVSVSGSLIRFIRWDRSGAVVSEAFSVLDHPDLFCQFFWRFAHITDAERGYDLTVEPATEDQEEIFRLAIEQHVIAQLEGSTLDEPTVKTALEEHYQRNAVTVIHLPHSPHFDDPDMKGHHLLVSRPLAVPLSVAGRSTRTYWAVDSRTGKVVLLKDTWRYDTIRVDTESGAQRAEREGDILEAMKDVVANIPMVVHQEDVPDFTIEAGSMIYYDRGDVFPATSEMHALLTNRKDHAQTTQTQDYVHANWACGANHRKHIIVKRIHYRLVLDIAGYTLLRLRGTSELLQGARDAFRALQDAYSEWKRFHGDITPGHIILYKVPGKPERKGYLVDWDLSRAAGDGEGYLQDFQVSSMLYVVLYCGVMYLPHKTDPENFRGLLAGMFDSYNLSSTGIPYGGDGKRRNKRSRAFTSPIKWKSPPFKDWLDSVMEFHQGGKNWDPVSVGDWWDQFLVQHGEALSRDDRQNNIRLAKQEVARTDNEAPSHVTDNPQESTRTSPHSLPEGLNPGAQKRDLDAAGLAGSDGDDGTVPPQKQQRRFVNELEVLSPDPDLSGPGSDLRTWRDGPSTCYPLRMSALSTPTVREGSYDSGAGTDGGYGTDHVYGPHFTNPDLTAILYKLAAQQANEEESAKDGDVKGKGRARD